MKIQKELLTFSFLDIQKNVLLHSRLAGRITATLVLVSVSRLQHISEL